MKQLPMLLFSALIVSGIVFWPQISGFFVGLFNILEVVFRSV